MVREIVNLSGGQSGNQIGEAFWSLVSQEHGLANDGQYQGDDNNQLEKIDVFFKETGSGGYTPRTVNFDLEPGVLDKIKGGHLGKMFSPNNYVHAQSGAGNNWAKGHYTEGAELIDE